MVTYLLAARALKSGDPIRLSIGAALRINENNKLFSDETSLGSGFNMINEPGVGAGGWYCVVEAKPKKIDKIDKIYIPESYDPWTPRGRVRRQLWDGSGEFVLDYIRSKPLISDPDKALRFSWFQYEGAEWRLQMVIPARTISEGNLGLWAKCFEAQRDLMAYSDKVIQWDTWTIEGELGQRPDADRRTSS
ncbi:hypothetical protein MBM_09019 [Drepanopeziza brunnea f. sp. 'multigermtubi' MB_m1]|uniref:Uncharacterized protein n=1 Tax=Marssonina brunnea f. sp. multigermtubi (strain MB_m1) TaxID=1072389 RepID=K1W6Y2_MARBU|nr:uncharacterized protein MBM_09019 [Drepanopeziza brunnea f. sp. 'multigermtubi' MB_m1]EKD12790.1 hypothetical protein MBM_09019 [Drepanopeziza brunnea f. sp. 'multigermtubi' MB_m1]